MSMLRSLEGDRDVVLLHSARTPDDVIFGEELRGARRACACTSSTPASTAG